MNNNYFKTVFNDTAIVLLLLFYNLLFLLFFLILNCTYKGNIYFWKLEKT